MERIKTLDTRDLCESAKNGGCGECQTSCQSACKTSCGVANQKCENKSEKQFAREVGFITKLISERIRHLLLGGVSFSVYVSAAILYKRVFKLAFETISGLGAQRFTSALHTVRAQRAEACFRRNQAGVRQGTAPVRELSRECEY